MNPDVLAQVCDAVSPKPYPACEPKPAGSVWERTLSWLFPPHELREIGPVDSSSLGYAYRLSRTEGYERNLAEINMAVKIGCTTEGEPAPVYRPGTRESRMAELQNS